MKKNTKILNFHTALKRKLPGIRKKQIAIVKYCATLRTFNEVMRNFNFGVSRTKSELEELIFAKIIFLIKESNLSVDYNDPDNYFFSSKFIVSNDIIRVNKLPYPLYSGTLSKKARIILRSKIEKYCTQSKTPEQIAKKFQISLYSVANFTKQSPILVGLSSLNLKEKKYETKYINISTKENKYKLF